MRKLVARLAALVIALSSYSACAIAGPEDQDAPLARADAGRGTDSAAVDLPDVGLGGAELDAALPDTTATDAASSDAAAADAPSAPDPDIGVPTAKIGCSTISAGTSKVVVNGMPRTFDVVLPKNTSKMALLFLWHGWLQDPAKFANEIVYDVPLGKWVPFDPNAFPMPLMIVTPHDTKMIPPWGLDWDIAQGGKDFDYFEGMLKCITDQFSIEKKRIYSFGFSAGAVFTNLLSAKYPHLFAATVSESGAWFNDAPEQSEITVPIVPWKWPAFDPKDHGNVLLTHGGKDDYATVISLENCAQKAFPFLKANGRTVVDCTHGFGHTPDPDLTQAMYYDFLWSHVNGGPALTGLPPSFPTKDKPVGSTFCQFRGP